MKAMYEIRTLIRKGKIEEAIPQLSDLAHSAFPAYSKVVALASSRLEKNKHRLLNNLISVEAASVEESNITLSLLKAMEDMESGNRVQLFGPVPKKATTHLILIAAFVPLTFFAVLKLNGAEPSAESELMDLKEFKKAEADKIFWEINSRVQQAYGAVAEDACMSVHQTGSTSSPSFENQINDMGRLSTRSTNKTMMSILKETTEKVAQVKAEYDALHVQLLPAITQNRDILRDKIERQISTLPDYYGLITTIDKLVLIEEVLPELAEKVNAFSVLISSCSSGSLRALSRRRAEIEGYRTLDSILHNRSDTLRVVQQTRPIVP